MRIQAALAKFVTQLEANGRSPNTISQYRRHVLLLGRWLGDDEIDRVDAEKLAKFLISPVASTTPGGQPKKQSSRNAARTSLRVFFQYLHDAGLTSTNPGRLIQRARCAPAPPRALSEAEEERLLSTLRTAPNRDRVLFMLMLGTGIRIGSALGLDVAHVDLDRGELLLHQTKGGREECVPIPKSLTQDLRDWIGRRRDGPVFRGRDERRISSRHARRRFEDLLRSANITRVRGTHVLRHSFGMRLYERCGDLELVRAALHHRSIASTTTYARCPTDRLRAAIGA